MIAQAVSALRCPFCGTGLTEKGRSLVCKNRHSFDIARQGYVNLLGRSSPENADTPEMVLARQRWLAAGWYSPIARAVAEEVDQAELIVEAGVGTGYYLSSCLEKGALGIGTDVSVAACKKAAKAHPRISAVVADTWAGLPLGNAVADAVLCLFAPRNLVEFRRLLRPGGKLLLVVPNPGHLKELRVANALLRIPPDKADQVSAALRNPKEIRLRFPLELTADDAKDLIAMGPNAFHKSITPGAISTTVDVSLISGDG